MRQWFPFTDYDFYAYLASGGLVLALLDFFYSGLANVSQQNWSFVQIVLAIVAAYITGQLVALLSSIVFEHGLARTVLTAPASIQLGFKQPNWFEKIIGQAVGRYYSPFSEQQQTLVRSEAAKIANCLPNENLDDELVFQIAFAKARKSPDTSERLDSFRNQYGFCRNISFVGLVSAIAFTVSAFLNADHIGIAVLLLAVTIGMTVRFLKFYASYSSEVLRSLLSA